MPTKAMIGMGSTFEMADPATPTVWTLISEVFDMSIPSSNPDQIDVTNFQSANRRREYIAGLVDSGEISFEMNYVPGSASDLALLAALGTTKNCRLTFPNGVRISFAGNVQTYEPKAPTDDRMTASVSFKVSGALTQTAAAAPANVVLPAISGTVQVGQTLTAYQGDWTGAPAFTFQWKKSGANISGATGQAYVPVVGDIGAPLSVAVTGTNTTGAVTATSANTVNVAA
jgi:predicted secreted protein